LNERTYEGNESRRNEVFFTLKAGSRMYFFAYGLNDLVSDGRKGKKRKKLDIIKKIQVKGPFK